jgi:hypothetical protein
MVTRCFHLVSPTAANQRRDIPRTLHLSRSQNFSLFLSATEVRQFSGVVINSDAKMVTRISIRFPIVMNPPYVILRFKPCFAIWIEFQIELLVLLSLPLCKCVSNLQNLVFADAGAKTP